MGFVRRAASNLVAVLLIVAVSACSSSPSTSTDTTTLDRSSDASTSTSLQAAEATTPPSTSVPLTEDLDASGGVDGPVMYWRERPQGEDESEDSEIAGTLVREGNCLFVEVDAYRSTVLWEFGTRWDDGRSVVLLPDGSEIALDSKLPGRGGGEHSSDELSIFTTNETVIERARACAGPGGGVSVVQR